MLVSMLLNLGSDQANHQGLFAFNTLLSFVLSAKASQASTAASVSIAQEWDRWKMP